MLNQEQDTVQALSQTVPHPVAATHPVPQCQDHSPTHQAEGVAHTRVAHQVAHQVALPEALPEAHQAEDPVPAGDGNSSYLAYDCPVH